MFSKMPVDCKHFDFGNNEQWVNYDSVMIDTDNIYTKLRKNELIIQADNEYEVIKPLMNTARNVKMQYNVAN